MGQNLRISLYPSSPLQVSVHGGGASAGASFFPPVVDESLAAIAAYVGLLDIIMVYVR